MFTVEVRDADVKSGLSKLAAKINDMRPVMQEIGEDIQKHARLRFGTSTGPDGKPWAPNALATIESYIASKGGYGKKGITKKGKTLAAGKKPLIDTGELKDTIRWQIIGTNAVEVGTNRFAGMFKNGAAIHQFGGKAGRGHSVTIPARPFLPVTASGDLYPEDKARVLESINAWLMEK
ncbi:MAG: hypothetical protein RIR18_2468 [Pseudomonadota bacterium]|jgi:phage virion morphogenesis protein